MVSLIYFIIYLRQKEILFLFWFISSLLWQTAPGILNDFNSLYDLKIGFYGTEKFRVQLYEFLSSMFWALPFLIMPRIKLIRKASDYKRTNFKFVIRFYIFMGLLILLKDLLGFGYALPLSFLYVQLSIKIFPIFCVYVVYSNSGIFQRSLALVMLLLILIGGGSHGPLVFVGIYALYLSVRKNRFVRQTFVFLFVGGLFLASFGDLMHQVRELDVGKVNKLTMVEKITLISGLDREIGGYKITDKVGRESNILSDAIWRFGENRRVSSGYLRWVETNGFVGSGPILNSLLSILPRQFWSEKPEPGSFDGSKYGKGMHVIHKMTYGNEKNMSSFYTGLHEYWLFGLAGVIILSFISGLIQYGIVSFLFKYGEYGFLVIIATYSIWWQMPKLWFSEILLHLNTIYLPLLLLVVCWTFVRISYRTIMKRSV